MTRSILGAAALVAAAPFLSGCSHSPPPIVPAEGVVLLNGKPLPQAHVQFVPMARDLGPEYIATGVTDEKGHFQLTCNGRPGACACENRVVVTEASPPEETRGQSGEAQAELKRYTDGLKNRPIPPEYQNAAKTPLAVTVMASKSDYAVDLKR